MPPPSWTRSDQQDRKERGGGDRGGDLSDGLGDAGQARVEADGDADGDGPGGGEEQRDVDAEEGREGAVGDVEVLGAREGPEQKQGLGGGVGHSDDGDGEDEGPGEVGAGCEFAAVDRVVAGVDGGEAVEAIGTSAGEVAVEALGERPGGMAHEAGDGAGVGEEMQNRGVDALAGLNLLELELVAPGDQGAPDELVGGDDDEDHGAEAVGDGEAIAGVGGGLQVGAEAGEAEGARAEVEHLAGDEGEPGAGDAHDGVPDQADGGIRELELEQALDAGEAVDVGGFAQLARDALQRRVKAEGHVPDGAGEDQDDRAHLDAELAGGEEGDHGEHDRGQEAEDGDRLEDVEDRDHEGLDAAVVGGDVAVADGEEQAEQVGEADADDGVEGVERQLARDRGR